LLGGLEATLTGASRPGQNWTFTFGSRSSTSSHLMPRKYFMEQAGVPPEQVFRTVAYSGSHDVVMQMVATAPTRSVQ
jgi:ABC-type phosphate/phosphonate transport system substrate-binding protein